jgi:hypothetical protein
MSRFHITGLLIYIFFISVISQMEAKGEALTFWFNADSDEEEYLRDGSEFHPYKYLKELSLPPGMMSNI